MSVARTPGGVVSVYKKYTVGSVGIWEKLRRFLAIDPERSTGIPLNPTFRNPPPGSVPAVQFTDPVSLPAGDIAENPFWQRDARRNYPQTSVFRQTDIAGLLTLGSAAAPRIAAGGEGEKQLVAVQQDGTGLVKLFEKGTVVGEVLAAKGMPPLPGPGTTWVEDKTVGFPGEYPCRNYK